MLWVIPRMVRAIGLATILLGAVVAAADIDPAASHSFKMKIASRIEMDIPGAKQTVDAETVITYSWNRSEEERTLILNSALVKANIDGKPIMNLFMSRAKMTKTEQGKTEDVPFESAPEELKKTLRDSFDVPLCKLKVDENGKEIKREVVAKPGAQQLIDQGMIANALLFHPPFMPAKEEWSATNAISMGNGGFARGDLVYRKAADGKGGQPVKISGTLTNDGFKLPNSPLTIRKARYDVKGEQTYSSTQREWVAGKLELDLSFEMSAGDRLVGSAKGTMAVVFEKLPAKK